MSAIAAIFALDGAPVDHAQVVAMTERLAYRGCDGGGEWSEGSVGLGHRMLWITAESIGEELPLTNMEGNIVITADARIDNREELIAALKIVDSSNRISDSQLILAAYERWGESSPERLLGDFAFAIWDARKQTLFCARDQMGVKPLYYYRSRKLFACASEIKALLALSEVPVQLNEARVADYLAPMLEDKQSTFYQGILRLPPAHSMTITRDSIRLRTYWQLDPSRELRLGSDDEYAEAFREIFTESVRCRLRSAFPLGTTLSGGLDSSSITCVARDLLKKSGDQLHTFSARFPDVRQCDEGEYIDSVVQGGGIHAHQIHADLLHPLGEVEGALGHQEEPLFGPNMFIHCGLYRVAQNAGVRVMLEGIDGDTTVSHGITYLNELARAGRWMRFAGEVPGLAQALNVSPRVIIWRRGIKPLLPNVFRKGWHSLCGNNEVPWNTAGILDPDVVRRTGLREHAAALFADRSAPARTAREYHWRGLTSGLIALALEEPDRIAAEFGIEPRYPFFDRRLVEFCLALPGDQKLNQGWTRAIMRRAMAGILPEKVRWRRGKGNLSPNFSRSLLTFERRCLDDILLHDVSELRRFVDIEAVRQVFRRYVDNGSERDAVTVWRTATLALWLRRFNSDDENRQPKTNRQFLESIV